MNNNRKNRNILTHETKNIVRGERLNNRDFIWKIVTVIVLLEIILIAPVISSFTNTAIIKNIGQISTSYIVARSGNPQDIQAAVDAVAAAGGGTVSVPEGTWTFNVNPSTGVGVLIPGGVNVIGAGQDKTILQMTYVQQGTMFGIDGDNGKPVRISGFTFKGYVEDSEEVSISGIGICDTKDFRIDHCKFIDFPSFGIAVAGLEDDSSHGYLRGVIDHCEFDNPYKERIGGDWSYGVGVFGHNNWDNLDSLLGQYDTLKRVVYIEDCTFRRCRYAVASNNGGWYVFRHNTVYVSPNYGSFAKACLDVHEGSTDYPGGRGLEAYDNVFYGTDYGQQAFKLRCGGGVIFNNSINDMYVAFWLLKAEWAQNEQNYVKNIYIWNNTSEDISKDEFYQENVHYFLYAKPRYTPYLYPHPLTLS
jgi:hypothetical protein